MTEHHHAWSHRVALADIPDEGLHVSIEADPEARAMLVRTANLRDLPRLEASFDLRRNGGRLHVTGEVTAAVGQNCVVTLDPIDQNLSESIDLVFAPGPGNTLGDNEASFALNDTEPPEPMVGGAVDLGAIATEYFLLGIDPYPRKEGAVFDEAAGGPTPSESPFAALASLRDAAGTATQAPKKPPAGRK